MTDWTGAACIGADPELFDQDHERESKETKEQDEATIHRFCDACSVKDVCLTDALALGPGMQHGIRGGLTEQDRRKLRRKTGNGTGSGVTADDEKWRRELHALGLSDVDAAKRAGMSTHGFRTWRASRNLPANWVGGLRRASA